MVLGERVGGGEWPKDDLLYWVYLLPPFRHTVNVWGNGPKPGKFIEILLRTTGHRSL